MGVAFNHEGSARRVRHETRGEGHVFSLQRVARRSVSERDRQIMTGQTKTVSDEARRDAGLSDPGLWLRYFELGGMSTPTEVESYLRHEVAPSAHDHDVLAQALNERFSELACNRPVQYADARPSSETSSSSFAAGDVQLRLLGSFSLLHNAEPVRLTMNAQRLVCFLALHDGLLLRQHIAGSLWGDSTERRAGGNLRSALSRLGDLSRPLIEVANSHLGLFPSVAVDLHASEALAHRVLDDSQDLSEADLDEALLSADLLPDWTEDWVLVEREHHTQLRLRALDALCRRLTEMGRFGQAVQAGMQAVSCEPLRESAQRALITAYVADGNVAAAVKQHDAFRDLLRVDLNLEPSAEMQTLVKELNR
jgi:DNA-binding SARP family transcriptional activator